MSDNKQLSRRTAISFLGSKRVRVRVVRKPVAPASVPASPAAAAPKFGRTGRVRTLCETVGRNRFAMVLVFFAVFVPALLWVLLAPPVYESELRILVKRERMDAVPSQAAAVTPQEIRSEVELLRSRELLEQVARRQGLVGGPAASDAEIERAVRRLEQDVDVDAVPDTNLIALRYAGRNPKQAADLLNNLAALYMDKRSALERNGEALEFFQEQAGYHGEDLEQVQRDMAEFARMHEVSLLKEQKEAALLRVEGLEVQLAGLSAEVQASFRRMEQLRQQGSELPETVTTATRSARNQALIEKLKGLLVDLEFQRTELLARYDASDRLVAEVEKKIADTQAALRREDQAIVVDQAEALNPLRQSVEADYFRTQAEVAGIQGRQRELRRRLAEQKERQMRLEALTAEHDRLARRLKLAEENYLRYEERKEQARIANALDLQQLLHVSIVEPANAPALPAERYNAVLILLGFLLASCSGVGAAVVKDHQSRPVSSAAEIAAVTGLPVLSTAAMSRR